MKSTKSAGKKKARKVAAHRARKGRGARPPKHQPDAVAGSESRAPDPRLLSRFSHLVERAVFELRLASDVARSARLDAHITRPLSSARRSLSACLDKFKAGKRDSRQRGSGFED